MATANTVNHNNNDLKLWTKLSLGKYLKGPFRKKSEMPDSFPLHIYLQFLNETILKIVNSSGISIILVKRRVTWYLIAGIYIV